VTESKEHIPVLLNEVLAWLSRQPDGVYIDGTLGGGGHAEAILQASSPTGRLLGLDADPAALARVFRRLRPFGDRVILAQRNFRHLAAIAEMAGISAVDGILLDLGLSSFQLAAGRGFSFQSDALLDMRFDPKQPTTAADLVNQLPENELADLIYRYGEERRSRRIARAIVGARPIQRADELAQVVLNAVGRSPKQRIHPATRTFQALRIAVNDELGALEAVLPQAVRLLKPGGRLVVISFHSLEDRIVKWFFRREAGRDHDMPISTPPRLRILTKKPVVATAAETALNPRSRSAKLRAAERR